MNKITTIALLLFACVSLHAQDQAEAQRRHHSRQTQNVIFYIGDGFGLAAKTATRMALGQGKEGKRFTDDAKFRVLALDNLKYNATVTTHSLNSWITDSAPGASVYACGEKGKVDNEVLSLDPADGTPIETVLENAKKNGYAVGLVTTTRVTHATPAAFASHIWYRDLEDYISAQFIAASKDEYQAIFNSSPIDAFKYNAARDWELPNPKVGVELDVILGGGARHFLPKSSVSPNAAIVDSKGNQILFNGVSASLGKGKRADEVDLIEFAKTVKHYSFVNSRDALLNIDLNQFTEKGSAKLLGLFNPSHLNYEQDRQIAAPYEPSLSEMTQIAIEVLKRKGGKKGFILVVEGGRIDHLAHANEGGISVIAGASGNEYTVDSDKPVYVGGGEGNYAATPTTPRTSPEFYGSDYLIKEVLAFDYAVAEGRKFLNKQSNGNTLIVSTSDHECGGVAVVGLHDENDSQKNGTKIRTYAGQITKTNPAESSYATPTGLVRGDGGVNGWYPEYTMVDFQGKLYPQPTSPTGKRIVIAFGSNPLTNGNGTKAGGTPGNHTPQDIWVGAEDNTYTHAHKISGRGLLDNTALTPIVADFLNLRYFGNDDYKGWNQNNGKDEPRIFPVPFSNAINVAFQIERKGNVDIEILDQDGNKVKSLVTKRLFNSGIHNLPFDATDLQAGTYFASIKVDGRTIQTQRIVKQ